MNQMRNFFGRGNQANFGNQRSNPFGGIFQNVSQTFSKFQQFMQNPISVFTDSNINIPQNIQNDPSAIINYMRSTGVMSDDQYNQASNMASIAQNLFSKR